MRSGTLPSTVSDQGAGYDTSHLPLGSGQRNMADQLAAQPERCPMIKVDCPFEFWARSALGDERAPARNGLD